MAQGIQGDVFSGPKHPCVQLPNDATLTTTEPVRALPVGATAAGLGTRTEETVKERRTSVKYVHSPESNKLRPQTEELDRETKRVTESYPVTSAAPVDPTPAVGPVPVTVPLAPTFAGKIFDQFPDVGQSYFFGANTGASVNYAAPVQQPPVYVAPRPESAPGPRAEPEDLERTLFPDTPSEKNSTDGGYSPSSPSGSASGVKRG
eukprot:tig00020911_g15755.t1